MLTGTEQGDYNFWEKKKGGKFNKPVGRVCIYSAEYCQLM